MSHGSELKDTAAQALRRAGFVPLPRLWVTPDQLDAIARMARGNEGTVRAIRDEAMRQDRARRATAAAQDFMKGKRV